MKQHELFSYAYDFLSQLLDRPEMLPAVRKMILFGSVVRGDFHHGSDLDLFIDTPAASTIKNIVARELNMFERQAEKTWKLRGIALPLKIQVGDLTHPRWEALRDEIAHYGKVVYGPFEEVPGKLKHYVLVSYQLRRLTQKKKMALLRALFGYASTKGKSRYIQEGLLPALGGRKVGSNALLIPRDKIKDARLLLKRYKVPHTVKDMWCNSI